jgi:hypothetical protein
MKVALVTTWGTACGIASHSALLKESVERADPSIEVLPWTDLAPESLKSAHTSDLIWVNHHAALHSRWTPEWIRKWQGVGMRVGATIHDTGVPNSDQIKALAEAYDAAVVHEPFDDLPRDKTHYWRMGVPELDGGVGEWTHDRLSRPVLGTVGHPFPWKNLPRVCEVAKAAGWGVLICCPDMEVGMEADLRTRNPWLTVRRGRPQEQLLRDLSACDATAFLFTCANTGQSASILQGVGARKPVLAFSTCRQMRALYEDPLGGEAIRWCETFDDVQRRLLNMPCSRWDAGVVALAEQDSWTKLGAKYAALYRSLVA